MKALSLGLIKGYIDEVNQNLIVTWIQPKYLEREKITVLNDRLESWINKTNHLLVEFEEKSKKIIY